jgi:hypothetical protein
VNLERLEIIAQWLEHPQPEQPQFDMQRWAERNIECGTTACIGGFADIMWRPGPFQDTHDVLDITYDIAQELFFPSYNDASVSCWDVSKDRAWAARCVRKLMATGKVDWVGTR